MKEEMCTLFELRDPDEARRRWTQWFEGAKASGIPALVRFAELKEKRLEGLVAHARHNISTGRLEGFNNKIKVAKRIGYGYRNEDYFFTLIRYMSIPAVRTQSPRKT
jgi:transposase